ncbi:GNAT family N-acetyltransferase [Deinococcus yavapaiensis]|uniref:RimJ/RimL family protein N-acetyltransferase n=1 Tax=Deinococcus yavapaiensis KR-236 TaxID=694435 RepID=A0A318SFE7_9DEIO|nr:GNAT family N-acetyltransferase [Deinococcus yavapaiensis]PYE52724.1 RimJ/RimL family protein N-acetyltransferase [Deinococcus yavapaiensis KR-236]
MIDTLPLIPSFSTLRLHLRPFSSEDAHDVYVLASDVSVAKFTFVPHPYPVGAAASWIDGHEEEARSGRQLSWAITRRERLVGCVELAFNDFHGWAEIGFWLGAPHRGRGYATEAAERVLAYAFEKRGRRRVQAAVFVENEASARVLARLGLRREGTLRAYGRPSSWRSGDSWMYGMTRQDFERR